MTEITESIIFIIKNIPRGKVLSYSRIAALAGIRNGARQVARVLHSLSGKYNLPWHRVVGKHGNICLSDINGGFAQRDLLESEGVVFEGNNVDERYFWGISSVREIESFS